MDYNSYLTKDFKNLGHTKSARNSMGIRRPHLLAAVVSVLTVGLAITLFSIDAKATRHAQSLNSNPLNQVVLPINIPNAKPRVMPVAMTIPDDSPSTDNWLEVKVRSGDSLAAIFKRHDLDAVQLHNIMQLGGETKQLRHLMPGQVFRIEVDQDNSIQNLQYHINKLETLAIQRDGDDFVANYHHKNVEKRVNHASAEIHNSLFEAGQEAGMSSQLIMEVARIFGWDIDFALDIRSGDSFSLIYEEDYLNGSKINDGPILAAEFVNQGKVYRAIRYTDPNGHSDYYDPNGKSMRKAFLRTPVDFRRISSRFGMRFHPILNRKRMHTGVDYAAPTGTPIKSTGDGKIIFIGRKGGYGKAVIIKHAGIYSTLYGHMSRFHRGLHRGSHVRQGQIIGYVGMTGRATGPHLHYEFRINGVFRNPLTVKLPDAKPINSAYKQDYEMHAQALLNQLTVYNSTLALNH